MPHCALNFQHRIMLPTESFYHAMKHAVKNYNYHWSLSGFSKLSFKVLYVGQQCCNGSAGQHTVKQKNRTRRANAQTTHFQTQKLKKNCGMYLRSREHFPCSCWPTLTWPPARHCPDVNCPLHVWSLCIHISCSSASRNLYCPPFRMEKLDS